MSAPNRHRVVGWAFMIQEEIWVCRSFRRFRPNQPVGFHCTALRFCSLLGDEFYSDTSTLKWPPACFRGSRVISDSRRA